MFINLACKVQDEAYYHVPRIGESPVAGTAGERAITTFAAAVAGFSYLIYAPS